MFLIMAGLLLTGYTAALAEQQASQKAGSAKVSQVKPKEIKVDRNYDGLVDRLEIYDAQGVITRAESDINGDGKIDEWVYYEEGAPVKGEKDINGDGEPDTTLAYDLKGIIIRGESDTNGDGKIDEWVYYEAGKPVKAEKDTNKDGKPDTWLTY
jgi:antitoxin component YwqK of YwqJK toxin-antitoxin module